MKKSRIIILIAALIVIAAAVTAVVVINRNHVPGQVAAVQNNEKTGAEETVS